MKNSNAKISEIQGIKEIKKSSKKIDSINLDKIKIDLSKRDKSIPLDKKEIQSSKSLYNGTEGMKEGEKKKFRSKIRRGLHSFCNQILGKDRSEEERKESVKSFLAFYKKNWKINDFKIESFTQSKDDSDLKDYKNLLNLISSSMGKK
jgi:hypothetical protein